jgi:hypothetical protein
MRKLEVDAVNVRILGAGVPIKKNKKQEKEIKDKKLFFFRVSSIRTAPSPSAAC